MTNALRAASDAVTRDDLLSAWLDPEKCDSVFARVILAASPHVAAGALADIADELHPLTPPTHVRARGSVRWDRWELAQSIRERAWRMLNWKRKDAVDLIPVQRTPADLDPPTIPLRFPKVELVAS